MRGKPLAISRPLISMVNFSSRYKADPISILARSAVRSPIAKPNFFLVYSIMALSNLFPPIRTEEEATIPPSEITAISAVPPPISITM